MMKGSSTPESVLISDGKNEAVIPKVFRLPIDIINHPQATLAMKHGVSDLHASASAQFSENSLQAVIDAIPSSKIVIFDLREESHGFINSIPVTWYFSHNTANKGKTLDEITQDELSKLQNAAIQHPLRLYVKDRPETEYDELSPSNVRNEESIVEEKGIGYIRLPVTDHHRPSDAIVDQFVELVNTQQPDSWFHFHCRGGKGRATLFFMMYDMMHNAREVAIEDIFARHALFGGSDFNADPDTSAWKYKLILEKIAFAKKFYRYCQESNPKQVSWTQWSKDE